MLPLVSERIERAVCRGLFLALCVLPTLGVAGWTYYQRLPGHRQSCQQVLARLLGLSVKLGAVEHTRPGGLRLQSIEIREPDTNRLVARAAHVNAARHGDDWWLTLADPEISLEGCRLLGEFVERRSRLPVEIVAGKVYLSAVEGSLRDGQRQWPIRQVSGVFVASGQQVQARLLFRWRSGTAGRPVTLSLVRGRGRLPPAARFELDSGDTAFPLAALRPWLACADWLGSDSTLVGSAGVDYDRGAREWAVRGRLQNVALRELVTAHFAHPIEATAEIQLEAQGTGQRVRRAQGTLEVADGGTIGSSLVAALGEQLMMTVPRLPAADVEELPFEELAVAFDLASDGSLELSGRSRYAERAVLVDRNGVLLSEPPTLQDAAGLIRALADADDLSLPAGPRAERLVRLLPTRGAAEPRGRKQNEPRASDNSPPRARS